MPSGSINIQHFVHVFCANNNLRHFIKISERLNAIQRVIKLRSSLVNIVAMET